MRRASAEVLICAVSVLALIAGCGGDDSATHYVDIPRFAETLRQHQPDLEEACGSGYPGFLEAAQELSGELPGAERFHGALATLRKNQAPSPRASGESELLRLLLHRYSDVCRLSERAELINSLSALMEHEDILDVEPLRQLLSTTFGEAVTLDVRASESSKVLVATIPASIPGESAKLPLSFIACLACRPESPVDGPTQIASVVTAFKALADSKLVTRRPIQLVLCRDSSRKPRSCAIGDDDETVGPTFALDGTDPLVVSWSAEVSWHLMLKHRQVSPQWLKKAAHEVEGSRREASLYVLDTGAEGTLDKLPVRAWMDLFEPGTEPEALTTRLEGRLEAFMKARPRSSYEVTVEDGRARVIATAEPRPSWEITERRNTLWDLAALAYELRVQDPPGGALASMLRVAQRFDGDLFGRRLGLSYSDPVAGSLLVSPCILSVRDGRALLGVRMYRPPGMTRRAFDSRLDEARRALRRTAQAPIFEAERFIGLPSRVDPSSDLVRLAQRSDEQFSDEGKPGLSGAPRPGLGVVMPDAISLKLPEQGTRLSEDPGTALILELIWRLAVDVE